MSPIGSRDAVENAHAWIGPPSRRIGNPPRLPTSPAVGVFASGRRFGSDPLLPVEMVPAGDEAESSQCLLGLVRQLNEWHPTSKRRAGPSYPQATAEKAGLFSISFKD